jgi:hypothetical protein
MQNVEENREFRLVRLTAAHRRAHSVSHFVFILRIIHKESIKYTYKILHHYKHVYILYTGQRCGQLEIDGDSRAQF